VHSECQLGCDNALPYGSNCQTVTEKIECCIKDAQRAVCRRACEAFIDGDNGNTTDYILQSLWAGIAYDIDMAGCAFKGIRFIFF